MWLAGVCEHGNAYNIIQLNNRPIVLADAALQRYFDDALLGRFLPNPVFSEEYAVIREAVGQARRAAGLSQAEPAARLGKAKSYVAMIERGQRRISTLELFRMAQAFGSEPRIFFASVAQLLEEFDSSTGNARDRWAA